MRVTASQLRANVYSLVDHVIETGEPLEIARNGRIVRLVADREGSWLDHLPIREGVVVGDPDAIVQMDWSSGWKPEPA